jgi:hypothetical protein
VSPGLTRLLAARHEAQVQVRTTIMIDRLAGGCTSHIGELL